MATVWKGAINFGLINVPVKAFTATAKDSISFRSLHNKCKMPINQKRFCTECGEEVAYADLVKGYEVQKGEFVEVSDAELKSIVPKSAKYIQILDFIKLEEVDPIYYEKAYFLVPEAAGEKAYILLHSAMSDTETVAVSKVTLREKEHLCLVRVYGDTLVLNTMFYPDEIRENAGEVNMEKVMKKTDVTQAETVMAKQIIDNLTGKFEPEKYQNDYKEQFDKLIEAKLNGREIAADKKKKDTDSVKNLDLFEKLKASVEATKRSMATDKKAEATNKNTEKKTKKQPAKTAKTTKKKDNLVVPKSKSGGGYAGV